MSFFTDTIKRFTSSGSSAVTCPICGCKSTHPASKIRQGQTLLCPKCKSLFVAPH